MRSRNLFIAPLLVCATSLVRADGLVIDKVYHPYVDALEQEVEFRSVFQDAQPGIDNKAQVHQFAFGTALNDKLFAELYLVGAKDRARGFGTEAWELELKWQIGEQGQYWADYGLLFEYEDELDEQIEEFTVGLLAEKELGQWSATANLYLIREWGRDIRDEFETSLALQARYRYRQEIEPAIEFYAGQDARGIGPALQGRISMGAGRKLHWESGLIFGIGGESPDRSWRLLLEYEF